MMCLDGVYMVLSVIDGDGLVAAHYISNELVQFKLYGIDAPEIEVVKI